MTAKLALLDPFSIFSLTWNSLLCSSCFSSTGSLKVPPPALPQDLCNCSSFLECDSPRYRWGSFFVVPQVSAHLSPTKEEAFPQQSGQPLSPSLSPLFLVPFYPLLVWLFFVSLPLWDRSPWSQRFSFAHGCIFCISEWVNELLVTGIRATGDQSRAMGL